MTDYIGETSGTSRDSLIPVIPITEFDESDKYFLDELDGYWMPDGWYEFDSSGCIHVSHIDTYRKLLLDKRRSS